MDIRPSVRKVFDTEIDFEASPERVFPLLCPVREYDWIDGWSCEMIFSESGVAELNGIFTTNRPEAGEEVWTISRYEPPYAIEFVRVIAKIQVNKLDLILTRMGPDRTLCRARQTFTGLSEAGDRLVEAVTREQQEAWAESLGRMANHYLTTGTMLPKAALSQH